MRNNKISISTITLLLQQQNLAQKRIQPEDKTHGDANCNSDGGVMKGAAPLKRNKAQHCSYLHARILHP